MGIEGFELVVETSLRAREAFLSPCQTAFPRRLPATTNFRNLLPPAPSSKTNHLEEGETLQGHAVYLEVRSVRHVDLDQLAFVCEVGAVLLAVNGDVE